MHSAHPDWARLQICVSKKTSPSLGWNLQEYAGAIGAPGLRTGVGIDTAHNLQAMRRFVLERPDCTQEVRGLTAVFQFQPNQRHEICLPITLVH